MLIPTQENYTDITPTEFEEFVLDLLKSKVAGNLSANIKHNQIFKVADGEYQIDGTINFEVMGVSYLTLVECKLYKSAISREKVQLLYDKIRATGAQKGILVTTSYFQSGAIQYAKTHGIALIQVVDGKLTYEIRASHTIIDHFPIDLPKYCALSRQALDDNIIRTTNVILTDYLKEFLLE